MAGNFRQFNYNSNNEHPNNIRSGYTTNDSELNNRNFLQMELPSNSVNGYSSQNIPLENAYGFPPNQSNSYQVGDNRIICKSNEFSSNGLNKVHYPVNFNTRNSQHPETQEHYQLHPSNFGAINNPLTRHATPHYEAISNSYRTNNQHPETQGNYQFRNPNNRVNHSQHTTPLCETTSNSCAVPIPRTESVNAQHSLHSNFTVKNRQDDNVLVNNKVHSPVTKSYDDIVAEFIKENKKFCKPTKTNVLPQNPRSNVEDSCPAGFTPRGNLEGELRNLNTGDICIEPEVTVKQEVVEIKKEKKERQSTPEKILDEFNREEPGSWKPPLCLAELESEGRTTSNKEKSIKKFTITSKEADRIVDEFNNELPGPYYTPIIPVQNIVSKCTDGVTKQPEKINSPSLDSIRVSQQTNDSENTETFKNGYVLNRSPSPERKYLHLVKVATKSPEREFLERLNNKSNSRQRRSRSRSISSRRSRDRSESPRRYRRSPNDRYSRSSSRSNSVKRSNQRTYSPLRYRTSVHRKSELPNTRLNSSGRYYERESDFLNKCDKECSEREALLIKYRKDYCSDINEMRHKLSELSKIDINELIKQETSIWTRMSPADLYYEPTEIQSVLTGTGRLNNLCTEFENALVKRAEKVRAAQLFYDPPGRKMKIKLAKHKSEIDNSSSDESESESSTDEEDCTMEELDRKRKHPYRLHQELWFNDAGEMNDGPLCRCSAKARRSGIRHNIYAGELNLPKCNVNSNNANSLYHYRITISPPTNFLIKTPTIISHDDHEFIFEGFSMFSHIRLDKLPVCKVIRFNIEYTILYFEEKMPENFTIQELDLFYQYLFKEILELVDLDFKAGGDNSRCAQFHFMPRFVRELPDNGKEILSMNEVLLFLLRNADDLVDKNELKNIRRMPQYEWQKQVDSIKGMIVTLPGMKPCSLRVDQLDRDEIEGKSSLYPEIVHFGIRPPQLSYAGNPEYQKAWREYVKFRHLLANMPKPSFDDKRRLEIKEIKLQEMRTQSKMKRDVTVTVNSEGFKKTGIMCDIVQHAMLIPVLVSHLRFHCSLEVLEETIKYKFENRYLLQLALTHPSYRENFGTNPDHARNSLTNCGIRQPEYGDRRIHYMNTRKRGINTLINIMSRFGKRTETESNITHNERLEFLGDAVVEFITSIHLFHMFPELEEGGLATYRAAIVQNQHLAVLAKTLKLDEYMLYAHGSDLCHDLELRHAMANCFEALMGALFLDGGIQVADKAFGETLFKTESDLLDVWVNYPPHPLQEQEPLGDRKWIPRFELLKKLMKFEESIGIEFTHVRLLARAFTDRSIGYTNLTLGSNQRLEFLGDTVLQLIASEYLYKYFPEHHEGHLSLLRSSLVNNRTQAVVCDDLGMTKYALYHNPKAELKTKDRADLLEAFLGALYVDKGLEYCEVFCNVCFFPRLQMFIMRQDWNDPKSKLQQCCLTLRTMEGGEPEIPIYKVIECMGPTNTRIYTVAVYFKGQRLAEASGHSIQQAEMNAAKKALQKSHSLFPQLDHQKRVIAKSLKTQHGARPDVNNRIGKQTNKPPLNKYNKDNLKKRKNENRSSSYDRNVKTRPSLSLSAS